MGKGGFGKVYKGHLPDGTPVAVKRLNDGNAIGGEKQFQTEVEMISLAVHRNLLRLYGFCMTPNEKLLVYPYMSNGSVAFRLRGNDTYLLQVAFQISYLSCAEIIRVTLYSKTGVGLGNKEANSSRSCSRTVVSS